MPYGLDKEHCSSDSPTCNLYNKWLGETRRLRLPLVALRHDRKLSHAETQRNSLAQPWYRIIDIATKRRVGILCISIDTDRSYTSLDTSNLIDRPGDNTGTIGTVETEDPLCKGAGRAAMCLALEMLHKSDRQAFIHLFTHAGYKVGREMVASKILRERTPFVEQADGLLHGYAVFEPQTVRDN